MRCTPSVFDFFFAGSRSNCVGKIGGSGVSSDVCALIVCFLKHGGVRGRQAVEWIVSRRRKCCQILELKRPRLNRKDACRFEYDSCRLLRLWIFTMH